MIHLAEHIRDVEAHVIDSGNGLPDEVFYFVTRMTPMVNVDLLIQNQIGETLLAWRDDEYAGQGWHIPGGIIRYKETFEERIRKVSIDEIGINLKFNPEPIAINEMIVSHANRGHFVSLLYQCQLNESFTPDNGELKPTDPGYLKWHTSFPDDMVKVHHVYHKYFQPNSLV